MKCVFFLTTVALLALGGLSAHAQNGSRVGATAPSTEEIVRALQPRRGLQTKSLRGVEVIPGQPAEVQPSIDLTVNFAFDSTRLENDSLLTLDRLGKALSDSRLFNSQFRIDGFTDARGGYDYNQKLSEGRAEAVRHYLLSSYHLVPDQVIATGYGKSRLADPEHPEAASNRRVQIVNIGTRKPVD